VGSSDLNAVVVPVYMTRAISGILRRLGDVCGRNDLRATVAEARRIALSLDRLPNEQGPPQGEHIGAKAPLPKIPDRTYRKAVRDAAFRDLFEKQILPVFQRMDGGSSGRISFHLILTYTKG
jgi:hypothetical protein